MRQMNLDADFAYLLGNFEGNCEYLWVVVGAVFGALDEIVMSLANPPPEGIVGGYCRNACRSKRVDLCSWEFQQYHFSSRQYWSRTCLCHPPLRTRFGGAHPQGVEKASQL
ncbi:hypothetical protein ANO14919_056210 [Xylariales sp. No.14919]|nr:hypothetical protein ANO14919_056210 [Xylariales sp. No.14919]